MPSKDVATVETSAVELALRDGIELPEIENPEDVARAIVARILEAADADAVLASFETIAGRELLGVPIEVHGVRWNRSSFTEGAPVYAILDVSRLDDGERMTVTTSGRSVMAALYRLDMLGSWPMRLRLLEAKNPTPDGYKPLRLARA